MTGYEIIILIAGFVFLIASFFFGGKGTAAESVDTDAEIRKIKEAATLQEDEVRGRLKTLFDTECGEKVADTEEQLARISNDKIIAIDEYASQVLEKIENNNQAVVFLYDMLQKKEDEMKSTMNKMEQTRRENKELFDRLEELKQAKARVSNRSAAKTAQAQQLPKTEKQADSFAKASAKKQADAMLSEKQTVVRNEIPQSAVELEHTQAGALTEAVAQSGAAKGGAAVWQVENDILEETEADRQEQVLSLYQAHKTVKEISKQLSMGQGEVKLIIDLYAGNNDSK